MNFFSPKTAAERFAKGRPFFHPFIIQKIKDFLSPEKPFRRALDVGCGTGFSTIALKEIAENIVGIDISAGMISLAPENAKIDYLISDAEALPFEENAFDLITTSQVLHWLDRKTFFAEARRVLKPKGWLIIYDNYFSAAISNSGEFQNWHDEVFLQKYPAPPRNWVSFTAEETAAEGFRFIKHEQIENKISFNLETLTMFLETMSNIIAAVEGGKQKIEEVEAWLRKNLESFFETEDQEFLFNAPIWFLQLN